MKVIMLSGPAGSGKDTVADILVRDHGAIKIAQADPMKRLAMELFGFSEETLWGPSERRNDLAPFMDWDGDYAAGWIREVLPELGPVRRNLAFVALRDWFDGLRAPVTARRVLQTMGTEWGRAFSRDMWIDLALSTARALLDGRYGYDRVFGLSGPSKAFDAPELVAITDGRFKNEILAVTGAGGVAVKIVTPGSGLLGSASRHASETEQNEIPVSWFQAVLNNDKRHGLPGLERNVSLLMGSLQFHAAAGISAHE